MPLRILIGLLTLIAAPLLLLGWLSASAVRADRLVATRQMEVVLQNRLQESLTDVQPLFQELASGLSDPVQAVAAIDQHDTDEQQLALSRLERHTPLVRRVVAINPQGRLLYPAVPAAGESTTVVERYAALTALVAARPRIDTTAEATAGSATSGPLFHTWYRDEGLQLTLWWYQPSGAAIGVLLERSAWIAALTARLPETRWQASPSEYSKSLRNAGAAASTSSPATIQEASVLVDEAGRLVYRWGSDLDLDGESAASGRPAADHPRGVQLASVPLPEPLSSWQMQYFTDRPLEPAISSTAMFLTLAALAVILVSLGIYVLTQLQRQMRLARNRVSFAGQVAHELRTPLTNIRLYTELAQSDLQPTTGASPDDRPAGNFAADRLESVARRLAVIDSEAQRLGRLVSGVMEVIREGESPRPLHLAQHVPDQLIETVLEQFQPSFAAAAIEIQRQLAAGQAVRLDADCLEIILVNLLSNVEKYAQSGGWVGVQSTLSGDTLRVRIADRGSGIPWRHRRTVFKRFRRLDDSISAPTGTGIGLTIARQLARAHGGDVTLVAGGDCQDGDRHAGGKPGVCFEVRLQVSAAES